MMQTQTFQEKVKSMSAKDIILSLVEGLKHPAVKVEMSSFGGVDDKGACFGCAATNTICKIAGKTFNAENIQDYDDRAAFLKTSENFLTLFESAISDLSMGEICNYNQAANAGGFAQITNSGEIVLPILNNCYDNENLDAYIRLADAQIDN